MVALRETVRRLETEHAAGRISKAELLRCKGEVIDVIPVVEEASDPPAPAPAAFWPLMCVALGAILLGSAVVALLIRDLTLALTLTVTVAAAITVRAARRLDL